MNRYGPNTGGGPSKATASTLCQKCLKRDIYECKAIAQDRPYVARPSRTQQLLNPKLLPKLTSDIPQDLLRKKGIADEQLARIEQERGRKRELSGEATESRRNPNRSRSLSSSSSVSVATISTSASRLEETRREAQQQLDLQSSPPRTKMNTPEKKRRRSLSSEGSVESNLEPSRAGLDVWSSRSTRRKIGEHSPPMRGRRRSRSDPRTRHTSYSSSSRSSHRSRRKTDSEWKSRAEVDRTIDPYRTGPGGRSIRKDNPDLDRMSQNFGDGSGSSSWKSREKRLGSQKVDESLGEAANSTLTKVPLDRSLSNDGLGQRQKSHLDKRHRVGVDFHERFTRDAFPDVKLFRAPPKERSLSPFSKRLALTQAMNADR